MSTDLQTILKLNVPVIVRVAQKQFSMEDVLAAGPGAILELDKEADEDLELLINNKPIGQGVAAKVGESYAIKITDIGSPKEIIEAMGQ